MLTILSGLGIGLAMGFVMQRGVSAWRVAYVTPSCRKTSP